eukprot:INCI6524.1.p1 GENE.INCI6524.1~~INCI6524.1.p1  ORF type:complete len:596 (-),score=92.35 INCI6524.1:116-1765(-)
MPEEDCSPPVQAAFRRITRLGIPVTQDFVAKLMAEHDQNIGKVVDAALRSAAATTTTTSTPTTPTTPTIATTANATADSITAAAAATSATPGVSESTAADGLSPSGGPEQAAEQGVAEAGQAVVAHNNNSDNSNSSQGDRESVEAQQQQQASGQHKDPTNCSAPLDTNRFEPEAATASELSNVALHKPCWQSSCFDDKEHPAKNAVDGIWQTGQRRRRQAERAQQAGIVGAAASFGAAIMPGFGFNLGYDTIFSHTKLERNAWIAVDLCATHQVEGAAVFNRTGPLMRLRLFPSWIFLLPEDRDYAPLSQGQTVPGDTVRDILALLVPAENPHGGRQGVVPGLLDRVRKVAVASQRLTIDMEGADDCPSDGKIPHRVVCREFSGRGRYVVLMLEGRDYLNVVQLQVWGRPLVAATRPPLEQGDEPSPTHSATPSSTSDSSGSASSSHSGNDAVLERKQQERQEQISMKGRQRHHIHATVAAKYAARRAQKRAERDQLKTSVSTAMDSTARARQAAAERNVALGEMGDKASALASNTNEFLAAARRLNSR